MDLHDVCVCVATFLFLEHLLHLAPYQVLLRCGKVVTALKEGTAVPPHDPANPVQK
jgi:hypothetical protein